MGWRWRGRYRGCHRSADQKDPTARSAGPKRSKEHIRASVKQTTASLTWVELWSICKGLKNQRKTKLKCYKKQSIQMVRWHFQPKAIQTRNTEGRKENIIISCVNVCEFFPEETQTCEHTCSCVMKRASPTWMIFPSWFTEATAIESSHTSEATYFSTLKPRSFRTR